MISAVFASMNRETNLIQSIASWIDIDLITEIIVVDWSSTIPLISNPSISQWLSNPKFKLFRVNNQEYFSLPKAYNLAVSRASNKIILKLDSDYKNINPNWMKHLVITENNELKNFFIIGDYLFSGPLNGFMLVNKKDFTKYNENFKGWGYDDSDLYIKIVANNKNLRKIIFFNITDYIYHIPHLETDRVCNYEIKDKILSHKKNKDLSNSKFIPTEYALVKEDKNYFELVIKT